MRNQLVALSERTSTLSADHVADVSRLQLRPIVLGIETKEPSQSFSAAEVQMGVWHAAQWAFLRRTISMLSESTSEMLSDDECEDQAEKALSELAFIPGIIVHGHRWFATQPDIRSRGPMYCAQGKVALKDDLEHICIENIQACILVGNNYMGDCQAEVESLYFALANRMAQMLNLGVCNESDDGITRETKRRIFWTCFITDTWASGGSNLSRQFGWQAKQPRVPMDEYVFSMMMPGDPDIADSEWRPGLWGHMVRLVKIYTQIQQLHRELAETDTWDEALIDESVRRLEADLDAFEQNLDPGLTFSMENVAAFVSRGLGSVFIAFHLGYHHYYTLLFYHYLDQRRPSTRNGKKYADGCKAHAAIICDVLKASREVPGAPALYNIVGHVTIVSSSVLLHTYLFGEPHELQDSKSRLESNLKSLVQLRSYWPSVELMINRLVVFQKNCIRSLSRNTHRFDKWMVKFLIAHSLALEDKADDTWPDSDASQLGNVHFERSRVTESMMMDIQNSETFGGTAG
ncbi:hypothetical protein CEP52_014864 [Fusarium oligoseptatum]|uniref:Transcription factor domain-containing protein n=1 Tax=Fusarium oligoseptatum TaxID=2604345 RepID=A0A428SIB5_9HYPO|nr:hypothetical protein CEP52_014864 [Fusarium oligoseptatum]